MKKILGIVVLGLLFSTVLNAKEIKIFYKDENSIIVTEFFWTSAKQHAIAAKHCAQYEKFAFDFHWGDIKGTKYKKARRYTCSKSNLTISPISGEDLMWTNYDPEHKFAKKAEKIKQIEKTKEFKEICSSLGYEIGTKEFADCAFKMMMSYKKSTQKKKATTTTKSQSKIDWGKVAEEFVPKSNDNSSTNFCSGFVKGYVAGYMRSRNTGIAPPQPYCPYQSYKKLGDPKSDYEHGYSIGYDKGSKS